MGRVGGTDENEITHVAVEAGDGFMPFIILSSLSSRRFGIALNKIKVVTHLCPLTMRIR